ncbi:methyltransferase domain-containing protein [Halorhabdus sp. CBA1104]|uniref:class I SAM-dependent methyltransferase n=1 Tax=unclassified Halorhabdus TaxID=2621901 RepID=UPI0012B27001|nr:MULTISPECIES: methyltransferase domain-containing protein [unclassified Halorhabdus]QGN06144.1 methyltransferase domain-containing protein [Halorhabdus sp. CBA1104]
MRRFDAEYLEHTRRGMWAESREALSALDLPARDRVLDVGCGTGELTRVLREETDGDVIGCDADPELLAHLVSPVVAGDAYRLPFPDDAFDLVVCQALLINLAEPKRALAEFVRVSRDGVAVIEPDNGAVTVESTVSTEPPLARTARRHYLSGVGTNVALGAELRPLLENEGLSSIDVARYDHERTIEPPYSQQNLEAAKRKVSGQGLDDDRATMLSGDLSVSEYDALRERWREMGRTVVEQMRDRSYERTETVPFYVATGQVPE